MVLYILHSKVRVNNRLTFGSSVHTPLLPVSSSSIFLLVNSSCFFLTLSFHIITPSFPLPTHTSTYSDLSVATLVFHSACITAPFCFPVQYPFVYSFHLKCSDFITFVSISQCKTLCFFLLLLLLVMSSSCCVCHYWSCSSFANPFLGFHSKVLLFHIVLGILLFYWLSDQSAICFLHLSLLMTIVFVLVEMTLFSFFAGKRSHDLGTDIRSTKQFCCRRTLVTQ